MMRRYGIRAGATLLGAAAGYAYYYYIGCASGACPITGHWWTSSLYGALLGFLASGGFDLKPAAKAPGVQAAPERDTEQQ